MNEKPLSYFANLIRASYGVEAILTDIERVDCVLDSETRWEGDVLVFALIDHPTATTCYAWETHENVNVVLRTTLADRAYAAVRRSLKRESRSPATEAASGRSTAP